MLKQAHASEASATREPHADAGREERAELSRDALIERGISLVRRVAFRLARRLPANVDVRDLISAGMEGLLKAVDAYDPKQATRFESYAEPRVRGAIVDELRTFDALTRYGRKQFHEVTRAVRKLEAELGRPPSEDEIAKALGVSLEDYQRLAEQFSRAPALSSYGDDDPDDVSANADLTSELETRELTKQLAVAIRRLPERTQQVLALYYQEDCTLAEVGQILGVTESRVCQILGDACVRLRAQMGAKKGG